MNIFEQDHQALYFGSTPLEHIFLTEYMPAARGDYVKVYLMCLYHSRMPDDPAKVEDISRELGLEVSTVENAIRYWERRGLIVVIGGDPMRYRMRSALRRRGACWRRGICGGSFQRMRRIRIFCVPCGR